MKYRREGDVVIWIIPLDKYHPELVFVGRRRRISSIARQYGTNHAAGGTVLFRMIDGRPVGAIKTKEKKHYDTRGGVIFYCSRSGQIEVHCLEPHQWMGFIEYDIIWGFECVAQLVRDGKVDLQYRPNLRGLVMARHPRTAYGVRGDEFIVVTVDGRRYGRGMTGPELAKFMASLGCNLAIMPDGGGSSEALVNGKIVNRPSDGIERPQPAALLFIPKGDEKVRLNINRLLRIGTRGSDVRELQMALNSLGYNAGPVDGIFGRMTREAVTSFQAQHGLTVDGIVGPRTVNKLLEVVK